MCAEDKTNHATSVSPDLSSIEQLATQTGLFSATSESLTASGCCPLRMGTDSQERCVILLCYDAVIAAGEDHVRF